MKNKITFIFMAFCLVVCGQTRNLQIDKDVDFSKLIQHFKDYTNFLEDEKYKIEISDTPIWFDIKEMVLDNPFDNKYPVSYSVIYQNKLISLFEQGEFVCHTISSMTRDLAFEKAINTKKFDYHWIIDGKLVGRVKDKYYFLNSENKWTKYNKFIPLKNQPKLFEDNNYISFCDCHGEWGGTVYFYNKFTGKIYFTEATCANSILKKEEYLVLSHLGHMMGSSYLKSIRFPDNLSTTDTANINKTYEGKALGYTDNSNEYKIVFDYLGIQIFSSFIFQGKTIYMVYMHNITFFAEIEKNVIKIINPLFNRDLYTHNPITTTYNDIILINLDFFGIAREREISCIIIKNEQLIKLDWNSETFP